MHYHSKMEEREKKWGNIGPKQRPKSSCANSKLCISMSDVKMLFRSPTPFSFVDYNTLLLGCSHFLLAAFLSRHPMTVAFQHPGVSRTIPASPSEPHTVLSLGLHAGTHLQHAWSQQLSLVMENPLSLENPFLLSLSLRPESCGWSC